MSQPMGEDFSGDVLRRVIRLFDGSQSKENGKGTLPPMKEMAPQDHFNGARLPFRFHTEPVEAQAQKGTRKRLAVDVEEAAIICKAFLLYLQEEHGHDFGGHGIAQTFIRLGISYRGNPGARGASRRP